MTIFGLTRDGFRVKRYADILSEKEQRARELFGAGVNLTEASPLGMFIRLNAWDEAAVWQQMEEVYLSAFAATAEGVSLDRKCRDIGISRQLAARATGTIQISGADGTVIQRGFEVQTVTGIVFQTIVEARITAGTATVEIEAVLPGAEGNVIAGAISRAVSPIAGVTAITNPSATSGGRDVETDAELRGRYLRSIAKPGSSTASSIEAAILEVEGVIDAKVRENVEIVEIDGIPAKAFAPIVMGGDGGAIAETILGAKAAGIKCYGTEIYIVQDSRGVEHQIGITRPIAVPIDVSVTLTVDALYPPDGDARVVAAITDYLAGLGLDGDVIYTRLISCIHCVPGIVDIPALTVNGGTGNVSVGQDEVAAVGTVEVART